MLKPVWAARVVGPEPTSWQTTFVVLEQFCCGYKLSRQRSESLAASRRPPTQVEGVVLPPWGAHRVRAGAHEPNTVDRTVGRKRTIAIVRHTAGEPGASLP